MRTKEELEADFIYWSGEEQRLFRLSMNIYPSEYNPYARFYTNALFQLRKIEEEMAELNDK